MNLKYTHTKNNDDRVEYFIRNNYECSLHCDGHCPFSKKDFNGYFTFCDMNEQTVNEYIQEVLQ